MNTPEARGSRQLAGAPPAPAPPQKIETIDKRPAFLRAARGLRASAPGFILQALDREDGTPTIRVGFTCSKKVGNAVARNRAKRRLREIARLDLPELGRPGWDYVLIGRRETTSALPFDRLRSDFRRAIGKVHESGE